MIWTAINENQYHLIMYRVQYLLLFLSAFAFNIGLLYAQQDAYNAVVMEQVSSYHFFVWLENGRYDVYAFDAKPKIIYDEGDLVIVSKNASVRYANEDVHKITFPDSGKQTSIAPVLADRISGGELHYSGGEVCMRGLQPRSKVYVYSEGGKLQKVLKASDDGRLMLRLAEFASGIYLLKTDTITYKILKK